ncbi:DsrE family protein [Flavobacterium sp. UBA6031]|uniref:DsrE family protein n=1 Tax=Flavobacterium sp. UBA6031 TaxID=1946551 RepID=UPI0025C5946A|nr:DsrE family protein [Flavobacterium sp. UBA6031]
MKKPLLLALLFVSVGFTTIQAQCNNDSKPASKATSMGVVIYSNDPETVWNALRLANYSKSEGDTVCVFLLGKGVEVDKLVNENNDIKEQANKLLDNGGEILGCGTCLQSRNINDPKICKFSSMKDLYELIRKSKLVLTF